MEGQTSRYRGGGRDSDGDTGMDLMGTYHTSQTEQIKRMDRHFESLTRHIRFLSLIMLLLVIMFGFLCMKLSEESTNVNAAADSFSLFVADIRKTNVLAMTSQFAEAANSTMAGGATSTIADVKSLVHAFASADKTVVMDVSKSFIDFTQFMITRLEHPSIKLSFSTDNT